MKIESKLPSVGTTIFTVIGNMANEHNALNLAQGFPNFESDKTLIDLVSQAMKEGNNQYAPLAGRLDLRVSISNKFEHLYNSTYDPASEITVTTGATQAIFTIISAFVKKNDEVIVFTPAYDCYVPTIELYGGKPISVKLKAPTFRIDWQELASKINPKTRMIILNTPHNPTGTILNEDEIKKLEGLLKQTEIIVLSDEVYEHMVYDEQQHQSICRYPELRKRGFVVASFGKTFHNTGWKMGYCCAPVKLMKEFQKVHQFNVFCANHPIQKALATYLDKAEHYLNLPTFYQRKRDLFLNLLENSRFNFSPSEGTYFQLLDYSEITQEGDVEFAKRLIEEFKIAGIPISVFNQDGRDEKMLRFCFAKTDDTLVNAAKILCNV